MAAVLATPRRGWFRLPRPRPLLAHFPWTRTSARWITNQTDVPVTTYLANLGEHAPSIPPDVRHAVELNLRYKAQSEARRDAVWEFAGRLLICALVAGIVLIPDRWRATVDVRDPLGDPFGSGLPNLIVLGMLSIVFLVSIFGSLLTAVVVGRDYNHWSVLVWGLVVLASTRTIAMAAVQDHTNLVTNPDQALAIIGVLSGLTISGLFLVSLFAMMLLDDRLRTTLYPYCPAGVIIEEIIDIFEHLDEACGPQWAQRASVDWLHTAESQEFFKKKVLQSLEAIAFYLEYWYVKSLQTGAHDTDQITRETGAAFGGLAGDTQDVNDHPPAAGGPRCLLSPDGPRPRIHRRRARRYRRSVALRRPQT
jgi:hypothetical protein